MTTEGLEIFMPPILDGDETVFIPLVFFLFLFFPNLQQLAVLWLGDRVKVKGEDDSRSSVTGTTSLLVAYFSK